MKKFVPLLGTQATILFEDTGFLGVLADDQSRPGLDALWASVYQGKDPFPQDGHEENSLDREHHRSENPNHPPMLAPPPYLPSQTSNLPPGLVQIYEPKKENVSRSSPLADSIKTELKKQVVDKNDDLLSESLLG